MKTLTIVLTIFLSVLCISCSMLTLQNGALVTIASGGCVPKELKDALPPMETLYNMLKKDGLTPQDIINYFDNYESIYKDNPALEKLLALSVSNVITSLNNYNLDIPLEGDQLKLIREQVNNFRLDLRNAIRDTDKFNGWCE